MQISLNIVYKILIFIGLWILLQPGLKVTAQVLTQGPANDPISTRFIRPDITQKAGELSFNIVRIVNNSDTAIRIKPISILPEGWTLFSIPYRDTIVAPHDSISLLYRFQLPVKVSSEIKHQIFFRAYSMQNKLLSESSCLIYPETFHKWDLLMPDNRVFFYPRNTTAEINVPLENKGNSTELINVQVSTDNKLELTNPGDWKSGQAISLLPYQDTILKFGLKYNNSESRVFDITRFQVRASTDDNKVNRNLLIEKYNDTYAPFYVDRALPHQVEVGFRTFSNNDQFLPFIKARGISTFKNNGIFQYNFNYYALTGNENFISNSYYTFLYSKKMFKAGLGAFSSQLGRNLYTRHGVMISQGIKLSPSFSMEAFVCQSFFTPKTSVAAGFTYEKKKIGLHGSVSYDIDSDKKVNTGSAMVQSNLIKLTENHNISFNLYGYQEVHHVTYPYTLMGYAWDINYFAKIGQVIFVQLNNNYGSPNIPGPQMGLLNFGAHAIFAITNKKSYFSIQYINASRKYYGYDFTGIKFPKVDLYDQYANLLFHSNKNRNHLWEAGPSIESYLSYRPSADLPGGRSEFRSQKVRIEYKSVIARNLTLELKMGLSNISMNDSKKVSEQRYDFHLLGGYSIFQGYGFSFSYDYGPMVNSGLYQFSGDAKNHSINIGPSMTQDFFNKRMNFNMFANFTYRFDLKYGSINVNPKLEAYIFRDWYVVLSGSYHYTHQVYPDYEAQNSYIYFECGIKKRWGKSDYNKWQKDTRRLKIILFKDDNGNGVKDDNEQGMPYVKTRLRLTNSDNPVVRTEFPVDIILLSNKAGTVNYNRLPKGFYELTITPLGDVKEYFYVDRSAEKLELTKNATVYIPFQKAAKITGKLEVTRQKFVKKGEEAVNLKNIKITAYNKQGNSYSSFTLEDGTFTIFAPGNSTYYLRMQNIFGSGFNILKNDIMVGVTDTADTQVVFNIVEINRQVKFKEAKPAQADTLKQVPLKIKVLHGKFYETSSEKPVDKNAVPVFNIPESPVLEQRMVSGNYYVVLSVDSTRTDAIKLKRIVEENGIKTNLGFNETDGKYYLFTNFYQNKSEARDELKKLIQAGLDESKIIKIE